MPKPQPTARQRIERAFHVSFKLPEQAAELLDAYRDEVIAEFAQGDARRILARHRAEVLTEGAELIQAQRTAIYNDAGQKTAEGLDRARDLLLAARTSQEN